jgi:hypothetical protein
MNIYCGFDVHKGSVFACIIDEKREKFLKSDLDIVNFRTNTKKRRSQEII